MMTQTVVSENIAHLDKTRARENMMTTMTILEANVTGVRVKRGGVAVGIGESLLGAKGTGKGVEVARGVMKGGIRSGSLPFPCV